MKKYILLEDKKTYRVEPDVSTWAAWLGVAGNTKLHDDRSDTYHVSTVFLGFDHGVEGNSEPVLFETMVFQRESGETNWAGIDMEQYTSSEEATEGHKRFCKHYHVTTTL